MTKLEWGIELAVEAAYRLYATRCYAKNDRQSSIASRALRDRTRQTPFVTRGGQCTIEATPAIRPGEDPNTHTPHWGTRISGLSPSCTYSLSSLPEFSSFVQPRRIVTIEANRVC